MSIKTKSYDFLMKHSITNLNFNLTLIEEIAETNKWSLYPFSSNKSLINRLNLNNNLKFQSFTLIQNNEILIFYNDELQENEIIFNILHEFGHLILNHKNENCEFENSNVEVFLKQEYEANEFAFEVLAPSCILKELNIFNVEAIEKISKLPYKHIKSHLINVINCPDLDEYSNKLITYFNDYINNIKSQLNNNIKIIDKFKKAAPKMTVVLIIISVFIGSSLLFIKNTNNEKYIKTFSKNYNIVFFATRSGSKYHIQNCRYVKNKNNLIKFTKNSEIFKKYSACSICIE